MPTAVQREAVARIPRLLRVPLAWAVMALALGLTVAVWALLREQEGLESRAAFGRQAASLEARLRQSLESQSDLLRACHGLFLIQKRVGPEAWDQFVNLLWSEERYPGLVALAYAPVLNGKGQPLRGLPEELWGSLARAGNATGFDAALRYSTPMDPKAWDPAARDFLKDPLVRAPALESLAQGRLAATPFLPLRLEGRARSIGFLSILPVHEDRLPGADPGATEGPGLLVAAFDLEAVLARTQPDAGSILMLLEDAGGSTVDVPLPGVAPGPESLRQERTMSFGGRSWTLRLASTHRFQVGRSRLPQGALAVGLLISLGLFLATALLQEGRLRTRALAGELGLSEANYRDLVEGLSDLVYRVDGAGRFTFLNEASQSLFGYEPGEMQGHLLRDFLTEEGGQAFSSAQDRVVAGEFLVNEPLEFRCKDGGARRVNVNARPLSDAAGRVIGTQGTMRDVTEMRRAQLALEESEEKFRSFADTVSCIILLFDDRIRYINAYATRMLGWSEAEILGQPFWAMVHPEDQALVRSRGEARVRGEIVPPRYEFRLVSKAGETRWVQFTAGRITLKGRSYGLATVFDITDRVEAEEARLRMERRFLESQKLESLGLLAGGVAHDFNNLLAAILGNAELASEMAAPDAAVRQPLEQIQNACMRASDLTRQMLAYAGQGKFVVEPLDLGEAVQGISDLMRASIPKLVEMRLDLAQERLMVEGDVAQIQQVILNLMTNAAESIGPAGGTVTLATGRRALVAQDAVSLRAAEALRPGPMVMLEVNDDGQGMDASTLDRIFDPFFTTKFQGRGLGLAAIQGIVRGHGGAIEVISVPGKGTTFRAYFPERVEG